MTVRIGQPFDMDSFHIGPPPPPSPRLIDTLGVLVHCLRE